MPESKEEPTPATREATAAGSPSMTTRESLHEANKAYHSQKLTKY